MREFSPYWWTGDGENDPRLEGRPDARASADAVFRPRHDRCFVDPEASCSFGCRQHTAVAKPVVARAQCVSMDEVGNAQRGEASLAAPRSRRSAGTKPPLVEDVGDLGIDVIVEKLVDEFDDRSRCFDLLCG